MMRTTVSTQPQIIIVVCCITLRRNGYDTVGNIRSVTTDGAVIKSFGYTNPSWPDLLTSVTVGGTTKDILYEGQTQTSGIPSSGNPVTYYNGKDYSFTWTKGRQLTSATVDGEQVSYTYDMSGVRSNKQVGDTTYTYTTLSGKVMRQTWGDNNALEFVYDDGNQPFAMIYKHGSETELYYYLVNAQGDVSAILDSSGKIAASYDYDAWGNCTVYDSSAKVLTDPTSIANLNPLRYRGYYYDAETGFYYLQSRYYDPAICRFINADTFATTDANGLLSANMFAYCENNPVMRTDEDGEIWHIVAGAVIGAVTNGIGTVVSNLVTGKPATDGLVGALLSGFVGGMVSATGLGLGAVVAANAATSMAINAVAQVEKIRNGKATTFSVGEMLYEGGVSAASALVGGPGSGNKNLTRLGLRTITTSAKAGKGKGIIKGIAACGRKFRKSMSYYWKNTKSYYRGVWRQTPRDTILSFFSSLASYDNVARRRW